MQVYEISTDGGRPDLYSSLYMENIALSKDGSKLLYNDYKGYEDPWRKHHQSSITRDIWLCTLGKDRSFQKVTTFGGEDRNPVWAADGASFYYLSEEKGSFNSSRRIWQATARNKSRRIPPTPCVSLPPIIPGLYAIVTTARSIPLRKARNLPR